MSEEIKITTEKRGHILLMGLNRPHKRNAFDVEMFHQLARACATLQDENDLRCGVLFAQGDHFTGGLDLPQWAPLMAQGKMVELAEGELDPLSLVGKRRTKPVIMAVQGICLTIGIELMLATDIRIAASDTRFGQIEIKRGIYPVGGATIRLPREVGWANAMRYLLTGDEFDAAEAYRMGLVQEVVEPGKQLERAIEIAEVIAMQAPLGVYATLESAHNAIDSGEEKEIAEMLP
ncbi:MAG TPA: crotonase/enoyl-CoA hydratase family protein, partial [Aggregatilineales bacterium]|nr:crotonase/enoyl-CoA hydratase family protein [Aggregatilineales bacterium]